VSHRGSLEEQSRVRNACQKTRDDLLRLQSAAAEELGEEEALIFGAHLLLLSDPMLAKMIEEGIELGRTAPVAVDVAFDDIVRRLSEIDDAYIQERIEDLEDLRGRLLDHILGIEHLGGVDARIVLCVRATPSLVVEMKARGAIGLVSEVGGRTSHGALLARSLGVPVVAGIGAPAPGVQVGDLLIVDGDRGRAVVRPTVRTREDYESRSRLAEHQRMQFLSYRGKPARTADGRLVELQANIALGADLDVARENQAGGVGLYRTEFPFIVRDAVPTRAEQARIYSKAYEAFPRGPVTFRLLDLGGDKFLSHRGLGRSRHAFHGYRSIRILFDHPHILRDQVLAFAEAADGRELRVLIPMVPGVEDVAHVKRLVSASLEQDPRLCKGPLVYGAMVETPAAVEMAPDLADEVEFLSIGTNDLIQYVFVVDREDPRMSMEQQAYHPAILRMVNRVVRSAHEKGKPVAVCGEMASNPDLAIVLTALGVDTLSITPRKIPEIKQALTRASLSSIQKCVGAILESSTSEAVQSILRESKARDV